MVDVLANQKKKKLIRCIEHYQDRKKGNWELSGAKTAMDKSTGFTLEQSPSVMANINKRKLREALESLKTLNETLNRLKTLNETDKTFKVINRTMVTMSP